MLAKPLLDDPPSDFNVDHSLAKELLNLSFEKRQAIQEEIHGVTCGAVEETKDLIDTSLAEFDSKINIRREQAEERVELDHPNLKNLLRNVCRKSSLSPGDAPSTGNQNCYLNKDSIRLRFLRCEMFDVDKAVERFICFLEFASEIFGDYVCEREIVFSDFSSQEATIIRNSRTQMLPFRDKSGRRVLVSVGNANFDIPLMMRLKITFFFYWQSSEDVETQRRGIVIAVWPFDEDGEGETWEKSIRPGMSKEIGPYQHRNNAGMPVRVASVQMYLKDTPFFRALSALYVFYGLSPERRQIYKVHFGEHTELLYAFGSYGISSDLLPVSFTGSVKFTHINAWINYQRAHEEQIKRGGHHDIEWVECPWPNDVIFRKGSTFRNNQGNIKYRLEIEKYSDEHAKANKKEKFEITHKIINEIEKVNGRFLEWSLDKQLWLVINERDRVRKKIAAAFKQCVRRKRKTESEVSKGDTKPKKIPHAKNFKQARNNVGLKDAVFCHHYCDQQRNNNMYVTEDVCMIEESFCFGKSFHETEGSYNL